MRASGRLVTAGATGGGALAWAWWATGREPFTAGATLAVVGAGVVAMLAGVVSRRWWPPPATEPHGLAGAVGWLALLAVGAAWQLGAYLQAPRHEHPTLSSLTNAVLDDHGARAAAFVAWLAGAAWLTR